MRFRLWDRAVPPWCPMDFDWYLLIGDTTAIPSFGRRLEGVREGVQVFAYILVPDKQEELKLTTKADYKAQWLLQKGDPIKDAEAMRAELDKLQFPSGDGFVWVAGEASFSREIYQYMIEKRGHSEQWIKAAACWTRSGD